MIWLVDATFVTMDTSRAWYQKALSNEPRDTDKEEQKKFYIGLFIRTGIVIVSLAITAPFLAQLVFRRDVVETIASRNRSAIANTRAALIANYEQQRHSLDSTLNATQAAGILEAAGKGISGRYGRGPAVIAMEQRVRDLQRRIGAIERERDSVIGQSALPGARGVQRALGASDSARARSAVLDSMASQ